MICAVTKYYQGDKIEDDDELGGVVKFLKNVVSKHTGKRLPGRPRHRERMHQLATCSSMHCSMQYVH